MICGVIIGGKDTLTEWGLMLCNDLAIGAAVPRYRFVTIPEMSGALDLTESLTGAVPFDQRTITFTLFAVHDVIAGTRHPATEEHFRTILSQFSAFANGKRLHIYLPDSPDHYFIGRVSVGGKSGFNSGKVRVEIIADPYRMKDNETVLSVDDGNFFKSAPIENGIAYFDDGLNKPMSKAEVTLAPSQDGTPWIDSTPVTAPYVKKTYSGGGNRLTESIIGATVAWNQLFGANVGAYKVDVTQTGSHTTIAVNVTATSGFKRAYVVIPDGHKVYVNMDNVVLSNISGTASQYVGTYKTHDGNSYDIRDWLINNTNYEKILNITDEYNYLCIGFGTSNSLGSTIGCDNLRIHDLTAMFGSTIADYIYSLEQNTAGSGIAKLKEWGFFLNDTYSYDPGSLQSVNVSEHLTRGFNLFDKSTTTDGYRIDNTGAITSSTNYCYSDYIPVSDKETYYLKDGIGAGTYYTAICYDATKTFIGYKNITGSGTVSGTIQFLPGTAYVRLNNRISNKDTACLSISDPEKNGTYEAYQGHIYALDSSLTLRGLFKLDANNNLYADGDEYLFTGAVTRNYGTRAYQSGDESNANAITDGTNTVYKLTIPTTESADPFTASQEVVSGGTEEYTDYGVAQGARDVAIPVGHSTIYSLSVLIEGHTGATLYVSPTQNQADATSYPVTFTDQGTVYGGTYDFVSGTLTVNWVSVDLGTLTWTMTDADNHIFRTSGLTGHKVTNGKNYICDTYVPVDSSVGASSMPDGSCKGNASTSTYLYVRDTRYSDYATFETAVDGVQLVYELATPQTYTLTPNVINSVLGINYAWSTEGEITLIEYQYNDTVVINNEGMPAIPTINSNLGGPTVTLGAVSHTLVSGDNRFTDFILQAGDNYVVVDNPAGTITFTYQEGAL